jgi:hypothetical protein
VATTNYVVDANVYISAFQNYYRFEFKTKFWDLMKVWGGPSGRVVSIDRVKAELLAKTDELSQWVKSLPDEAFVSTDRPDVFDYYGKLNKWAQAETQYTTSAKAEFANGVDAWIVAYALAGGHTVVTHEGFKPDAQRRILIPNACKAFAVPYVNTFEMLSEIQAKLG